MIDAPKGLKTLLAILEAQKLRGWAAHYELDYFKPCPTCGHWFDCRNPENLIKHKHTTTVSIVVTAIVSTPAKISDRVATRQNETSPSNVTIETPNVLPETPAGGAKS